MQAYCYVDIILQADIFISDMPIGYTVTDLPSVFPLNNVSTFNLSVPLDDIINEPDGLLRFTLQTTPGSELPAGLFLTNPLEVTVQDGTGIMSNIYSLAKLACLSTLA